ncbi:glutaredoxin-like protein NrdH [Bifidobacterium sp. ESL0769]|uniref:glutaredoxin-like protein NrdH n=1 Tax=Bifidobacterium sp. ESL0769 TaxID=2983229 RepID=UPI0023F7D177|nr:glutaredoxin-like protein NrdH [Bifidobacterium sp. ESL0769]WEV67560.1 glutaredoxin-like protein NrdH [Bifidobacterium sp. ESL0769]
MTVTVFTKPRCPQCEATKRQLTRANIAFEAVDLTENPSTLEQLTQAGFRQAPVVITPDASWSGYRPDLIKQLATNAVKTSADAKASQSVLA